MYEQKFALRNSKFLRFQCGAGVVWMSAEKAHSG